MIMGSIVSGLPEESKSANTLALLKYQKNFLPPRRQRYAKLEFETKVEILVLNMRTDKLEFASFDFQYICP